MTDHYKMVRDKHEEQFGGKISGTWRVSPDPVASLTAKLLEEAGEFVRDRDPGELLDMTDVINELLDLLDPDGTTEMAHDRKTRLLGMFRTHLEWECWAPAG